jgi:hypothetical protein
MIHTIFGGNQHGNGGWATLSKVSLLTGAANFPGGLPVLKHSVVKIAEFLHSQHSDKLTCLQLPRPDQALRFSHVDEICAKIEILDAYSGIIAGCTTAKALCDSSDKYTWETLSGASR